MDKKHVCDGHRKNYIQGSGVWSETGKPFRPWVEASSPSMCPMCPKKTRRQLYDLPEAHSSSTHMFSIPIPSLVHTHTQTNHSTLLTLFITGKRQWTQNPVSWITFSHFPQTDMLKRYPPHSKPQNMTIFLEIERAVMTHGQALTQ